MLSTWTTLAESIFFSKRAMWGKSKNRQDKKNHKIICWHRWFVIEKVNCISVYLAKKNQPFKLFVRLNEPSCWFLRNHFSKFSLTGVRVKLKPSLFSWLLEGILIMINEARMINWISTKFTRPSFYKRGYFLMIEEIETASSTLREIESGTSKL